jgi:hypothetical protein
VVTVIYGVLGAPTRDGSRQFHWANAGHLLRCHPWPSSIDHTSERASTANSPAGPAKAQRRRFRDAKSGHLATHSVSSVAMRRWSMIWAQPGLAGAGGDEETASNAPASSACAQNAPSGGNT